MTTSNHQQSDPATEAARNRWLDDAQAALDRTAEAIRSAWDSTRESRMEALESAKQAAEDLSEVIAQGVAAAKERWSDGGENHDETADHDTAGHDDGSSKTQEMS
jgi:hypothetical protein